TRMAISPRFATKRLRSRCGVAGFTLRSAVRSVERARESAGRFDNSRRGNQMSRLKLLAIPCLLLSLEAAGRAPPAPPPPPGVTLVSQGGAGVIAPAKMTPEKEASYRAGLAAALDAGYAILERGGSSLDAVTAAVRMMEDDPQFNAGRGAVLNHAGEAEL